MKDETLFLRGLQFGLTKTNLGKRNKVYYNDQYNNMILITPYDKDVDEEQICNGIRSSAYSYLINTLNNNENVVVNWGAVSGTTSDYKIYYDICSAELSKKSHKEILKCLSNATDSEAIGMKYCEIYNGIETAIQNI